MDLWTILFWAIIFLLGFYILSSLWIRGQTGPKKITDFTFKHVIITGASAGLGKSLTLELAKRGAHLTLIARGKDKLERVRMEAEKCRKDSRQKILVLSADVSLYEDVEVAVKTSVKDIGVPDLVIANAGAAHPGYFIDLPPPLIEKEMKVNYLGEVHLVKAALPFMVDRNQGGHILFVSSAAAFASFIGFSTYSPTKAAIRVLAESLRNEFLMYGIGVSAVFPGPIKTEGFEEEEKTKPSETKEIEGQSDLMLPEEGAKRIIRGLEGGYFIIPWNFFPEDILRMLSHGITYRDSPVFDLFLTPILVFISPLINYLSFDSVVLKSKKATKKRN